MNTTTLWGLLARASTTTTASICLAIFTVFAGCDSGQVESVSASEGAHASYSSNGNYNSVYCDASYILSTRKTFNDYNGGLPNITTQSSLCFDILVFGGTSSAKFVPHASSQYISFMGGSGQTIYNNVNQYTHTVKIDMYLNGVHQRTINTTRDAQVASYSGYNSDFTNSPVEIGSTDQSVTATSGDCVEFYGRHTYEGVIYPATTTVQTYLSYSCGATE